MKSKDLSQFQSEQLLSFFKHYMTMEQRTKLIRQLPEAYNAFVGEELFVVTRVETGESV